MDRNERSSRSSRDNRESRDEGRSRSRGRDGGDSDRGRGSFEYTRRGQEAVKKRAEQSGGDFDRYLKDGLKAFKTNDGNNFIRFLPPTWKDPQHYGHDIFVHYSVGADNQTYVCPDKMKDEPCPVCEELHRAKKDDKDDKDEKYIKSLEPKKRVLVYLINRDQEREGVMVWSMPWTLDRDICKVSQVDRKTGETLFIDDPDKGYDVEFERKGSKDRTEYIGVAIARRESPLGNDKWLQFAVDNPLPDQVIVYPYEDIQKALGGGGSRGRDKDENDKDRGRSSSRSNRDDSPTWDSVHKMTFDQMCDLVDAEKLDIDPDKSKDDEDLAAWLCEELKLTKEKDEPASRGRERVKDKDEEDPREKLRSMRESRERS